jgi:hypothetical protein
MIEPLLSAVAALRREIERLDKAVMARAKSDPACRMLITGEAFRWPEKAAATTA